MRPFRSVLYMPGSNQRALEKAKSLAADALILDLEDAVAPDAKAAARDLIASAINNGGYGSRYLIVRLNGSDTEWGQDDIAAISACKPDALLLPKVNDGDDIEALARRMDAFPNFAETKIWAMMETPLGVLNALSIAGSSPKLEGFVLGTNDLVKDMHAFHTADRAPVLAALSTCVMAARAHGLVCVDGVFNDIKNVDGLKSQAEQGRALGFDGITLIHPAQLEAANKIYAPSEADLDEAREFVAAYDAALAEGKAVAVVNGRIVENLHVENAKRLLAQADAIAAMSG